MIYVFNEESYMAIRFYDSVIYTFNKDMNVRKFLEIAGVRENSYFGHVFIRIYNYLTRNAINLKEEYNKYYKKEFSNFFIFLQEKFNIPEHVVNNLTRNNNKLFYKNLKYETDYNIDSLLEEKVIANVIIEFFGGGNVNNED